MTITEALESIKATLQAQYADASNADASNAAATGNFICLIATALPDKAQGRAIRDHIERGIAAVAGKGWHTMTAYVVDMLALDDGTLRLNPKQLGCAARLARFYWLDHAILATSNGEPLPPLPSKADLQILWERAK